MSTSEIIAIIATVSNLLIVLATIVFSRYNIKSGIKSNLFYENQFAIYTDLNIILADVYSQIYSFNPERLSDVKNNRSKLVKIMNSKRFFLIEILDDLYEFESLVVEVIANKNKLSDVNISKIYSTYIADVLKRINKSIFKNYTR